MVDKKVQDCKVRILEDEYCLVTNESHEHIIESAHIVDSLMREITQNSALGRIDEKKSAVLTALRIASRALKNEAAMRELLEKSENLVAEIDQELQRLCVGDFYKKADHQ
jgi:cell division protein ZapA (FtsZ GTPase activity inhibitor)